MAIRCVCQRENQARGSCPRWTQGPGAKGACYKRAATADRSLPHHLLPLPLAPFTRNVFELRVANGETRQPNNILDTEILWGKESKNARKLMCL